MDWNDPNDKTGWLICAIAYVAVFVIAMTVFVVDSIRESRRQKAEAKRWKESGISHLFTIIRK